jgi:hypothetical protein
MDALARGDRTEINDARMHYGNQYQSAFERIGSDAMAKAVARYLEETEFGFEAAQVLKSISDRALNVPKPDPFRRWPWFDGVAAARDARAEATGGAPANSYAEPILDGQILDSSIVMQGIDEWLADANGDANKAWHKRQNTWEIERWLELLPFTDAPEGLFEGLEKVKDFYTKDWAQRWARVLTAVAWVQGAEGETFWRAFAEPEDNTGEFEWMRHSATRTGRRRFFVVCGSVCAGVFRQSQWGRHGMSEGIWPNTLCFLS